MKTTGKPSGMNIGTRGGSSYGGDPSPAEALANIPGVGITKTEANYQTALVVQVPRDIEQVEAAIIKEAALMGEDFIYAWEVNDKESKTGKSRIEGLSIDGAMVMFRNWMNCTLPTHKIDETPTHFEFEATFIDLEMGISITRGFRQRKGQRSGRMDSERAEDIAYQIGWSKAQRNAIDKSMPSWLTNKAIQAAKDQAIKRYANDMPKARADVKTYANGLGITDAELEAKVGTKIDDWVPTDIVYIRSVFRSISKKESTIGLEFRAKPDAPTAADSAPAPTPEAPGKATDDFPELKPEPAPAPAATAAPAPEQAAPPTPETAPNPQPAPAPESKPAETPKPKAEPKPDFEPPKAKK